MRCEKVKFGTGRIICATVDLGTNDKISNNNNKISNTIDGLGTKPV